MTSAKSAENASAYGTIAPGPFPGITDLRGSARSPSFDTGGDTGKTDRFSELFRLNGIELSSTELDELTVLEEFLARHVGAGGNCDVQCMLLWNEWVRVFRRRTSGFPNLVREKEFKSIITGMYGTLVADDGWRGAIYPGVRYVP